VGLEMTRLVVFLCSQQRLKTLGEFRTMSLKPYTVNVYRASKWSEVQSDELLPGDLVSIGKRSFCPGDAMWLILSWLCIARSKEDSGVPCDLILLRGSCIVNEAMLSGESTPLLKESIELKNGKETLDIGGADRNSILFGGTKVLQATAPAHGDINRTLFYCHASLRVPVLKIL
jgi:manganese-transporting P-type ATPase